MMNQQRLEVRVAIILAGLVMFVVLAKRSQMLQPLVDVLNEPALIVVDVNAGGNVHGRYQHHAFLHPALSGDLFNLRRDMHIGAICLGMKLQVFGKDFHSLNSCLECFHRFYRSLS